MIVSSDALVEIMRFAVHDLYDWSKFQRVCKQWHTCCRIPRAMASVTIPLDSFRKLDKPLWSMIHAVEHVLNKAEDVGKITDMRILDNLPLLDTLVVNGRSVDWSHVADFARLRTLHVWNCDQNLESLFERALFLPLKDLELRKCLQVDCLKPIQKFDCLERLSLQGIGGLGFGHSLHHSVHVIGTFFNLKHVQLIDCLWLRDLDWIVELAQLSSLSLSGCAHVRSLKPLRGLTQLMTLDLNGCSRLALAPVKYLRSLWQLRDFSACGWFPTEGLMVLMTLTHLKRVDVQECDFERETRKRFAAWCRQKKISCNSHVGNPKKPKYRSNLPMW